MENKVDYKYLYLCVFTGMSSGLMETWSSPILPKLTEDGDDNPLSKAVTSSELSLIYALQSLGAAVGPFISAFSAEKLGRKWTLIGIATIFVTAQMILAFSKILPLYYVGRVIAGLSVGSVYTVLPNYISEVSPKEIRGTMGSSMNVFIVTGLMIPYLIGPYTSVMVFTLILSIVPLSFIVLFSIFNPESPLYLIASKQETLAKGVIKKLHNGGPIEEEYAEMQKLYDESLGGTISDVFTKASNRKALCISASLVAFQQFSGVNIVLPNANTVFEATGSSIPSDVSSIIIGAVQVLSSFVTPFVVDRWGRRVLLIGSAAGMFFAELPLGLYFYLKDNGDDVEDLYWLPIVCLISYIVVYNFGSGPLPWTVMAELFPPDVKNIAASLTAFCCWTVSFFLTYFYDSMVTSFGIGETFWFFTVCNVVAVVFTYFYLPETKGKSISEIQEILKR